MIHRQFSAYIILLIATLIAAGPVSGNGQSAESTDSIEHHAYELIRNRDLEIREKSFDYLNKNLGAFLMKYSTFQDSFPRLEGLAILEDKNLRVRIITYQLYRDTSTYEYGGWVQSEKLTKPVFLTDASRIWEDDQDLDYMELDTDNWYGAIYYQMQTISHSAEEMVLLLFGLDNYHFFTKRKVLETMVIRDGTVHFGQSMIEMEEGLPRVYWKRRFILDYSAQAPATLRYDSDRDKIIFDHLIFMQSDIPEQKIMRVPDGTYSGFEIDKKGQKLVFIEKVFHEVMDEAPGGRKKPDVKRDLFGNPQKDN